MKHPNDPDTTEPVTEEAGSPPSERDRVFRNTVLEEAAIACERPSLGWHEPVTARQCAERIRALKMSAPEKPAVQP
jgi:hypothetical protein